MSKAEGVFDVFLLVKENTQVSARGRYRVNDVSSREDSIMKHFSIMLGLFLLGCSPNHSNRVYKNTSLKDIEFLQFTKKQHQWMEALAVGKLVLDKSCFKFTDGSIIIFPASFYLDFNDGKVIIKDDGRIVGIEGKVISTGGGWVDSIDHLPVIKPMKCKGNGYFIVGQGFKLI